jgi:hypothetical protein
VTYQAWLQNGRFTALVWAVVFVVFITFRVLRIDDGGAVTNAFVAMTGILVGNLGIAQGRRSARSEEDIEKLKATAIQQHPETREQLDE